jgi:xanthine phosphoribosyltransferase
MNCLEEKIIKDGIVKEGNVLKVDSFINHQMDVKLFRDMGKEWKRRFADKEINKILTIEASGIAPAVMVGFLLNVPVVFAKKKKPSTMADMLVTEVFSFTKNTSYSVCVAKEYLHEGDNVLFIDDFLANGEALRGLISIVEQCNASVVGCCVQIEKEYQNGGNTLRNKGYKVIALASIKEMTSNIIQFN